ncbi:MAG: PD40 domain-containing protein [Bacteroidetes bacterium]|nr:PD40 domain-containing protein [Bacteroidota bacterium]
MKNLFLSALLLLVQNQLCAQPKPSDTIHYSREKHFKNVRQLTFGADNAEAYWSFDGKNISFQSNNKNWDCNCDQIFYMPIAGMDLKSGKKPKLISTGMGRTTCAFFMPDGNSILYASTHLGGKDCPKDVEHTPGGKYLWPIYESYDIFVADKNGKIIKQLTRTPGYDAEATVSPIGDKIVFTSTRNGDLDLYVMDIDGKKVKQITNEIGYDGGAFFSPNGKKIVFRASRFKTDQEKKEYLDYLKQGLVAPTAMEIFTCNVDGTDLKQVTSLGKANWAPFYNHAGTKIIFSSNHKGKRGFEFNLFMVNEDGSNLEQITFDKVFDSFPMFSPDGKKLIFSSNRNNGGTRNTNLFVADWVD